MRTRESTATLWVACESFCVSWAGPRGVGFVDLILRMQGYVFDSVSLPVSGGESRFMFF
jgi:hypothetical protein